MDVVRTNIAKLGGTVDVESELGKGTNIVVTLPLTLAIIPSLIVQVGQRPLRHPAGQYRRAGARSARTSARPN